MAEKYGIGEHVFEKLPVMVQDAFSKADSVINNDKYTKVGCSVSGGADSDVMMDLITRVDRDKKTKFYFFNTGIEFRATLEHLEKLEEKYGVPIVRINPIKSIPTCCNDFGTPVISKFVSEQIGRLQSYGFDWREAPMDELLEQYPQATSSIKWWCNGYQDGRHTQFNIGYNKWLKLFIMSHPPKFRVSAKCCHYTKKLVARQLVRTENLDLLCTGIRRCEGGVRRLSYANCLSLNKKTQIDNYRPLFWIGDADKAAYCEAFDVTHSRCYTEYGFRRTGCAGCPFARGIDEKLESVATAEPQMVRAAHKIFGAAYDYTRKYRDFQAICGTRGVRRS